VPGKNSTRSEDATTGNTAASHSTSAAQEPHPPAQCDDFDAMRRADVIDGAQARAAIEPFVSSSSSVAA
jgi:hypothetical protein